MRERVRSLEIRACRTREKHRRQALQQGSDLLFGLRSSILDISARVYGSYPSLLCHLRHVCPCCRPIHLLSSALNASHPFISIPDANLEAHARRTLPPYRAPLARPHPPAIARCQQNRAYQAAQRHPRARRRHALV
ncbi:hypothetical protein PsYK624_137240 [Phanerochaete sordida]|uniref:Uncharacterized protein n=1 Tax=Phanerochaete sordida TaxID=48140 RepID=A0A9P3GKD3_9APHY|nr:hypothetical protein PsYK624_137240 [Phanerochaete sordida]